MQIHGREEYPSSQILFSQTELVRRNDFVSANTFSFRPFLVPFSTKLKPYHPKGKICSVSHVRPPLLSRVPTRTFMKSADKSIRDGELVPTRGICIL